MKEIILPYNLFQRIKASAGERGGVGRAEMFIGGAQLKKGIEGGVPLCAHGHAWGTCTRFEDSEEIYDEPELSRYISFIANDIALAGEIPQPRARIPFERWCELLNVKCGPKPEAPGPAQESFANYAEALP